MSTPYDPDALDGDLDDFPHMADGSEGELQYDASLGEASGISGAGSSPDGANGQSGSAFAVDQNIDATRQPDGADVPPDDTLEVLSYFTRHDIMRLGFDAAFRLYQSVAVTDSKLVPVDAGAQLFRTCLHHTVNGMAMCLNDDVMNQLFEKAYADLQHSEDPWFNAIRRELARIEQAAGRGAP